MENNDIQKVKEHEHRHTMVEQAIEYFAKEIEEIKTNHLAHLNKKMNWMIGLFVTGLIGIIGILVQLILA